LVINGLPKSGRDREDPLIYRVPRRGVWGAEPPSPRRHTVCRRVRDTGFRGSKMGVLGVAFGDKRERVIKRAITGRET